jgi:hypothetical protein
MLVAVGDDFLRQLRSDTCYIREQRWTGGIHIHTHGVHHTLHYPTKSLRELFLVDIMLVHADPIDFRVDFHQFSQWVLRPAGVETAPACSHLIQAVLRQRAGTINTAPASLTIIYFLGFRVTRHQRPVSALCVPTVIKVTMP